MKKLVLAITIAAGTLSAMPALAYNCDSLYPPGSYANERCHQLQSMGTRPRLLRRRSATLASVRSEKLFERITK